MVVTNRPKSIYPYPVWHMWFSLLIGIALLLAGLFWAATSMTYVLFAETAEAKIVGFVEKSRPNRKRAFPVYKFVLPSGEIVEIKSHVSGFRKAFDLNEKVQVMYFKNSPEAARILSFDQAWLSPLFFVMMGLFWTWFGAFRIIKEIYHTNLGLSLKSVGNAIQTRFVRVDRSSFGVGRPSVSPFVIVSSWQDQNYGILREFKSSPIWFDPTPYLPSDQIQVFVHPKNKKKYWMDIDFLPKPIDK